MKEERVLCVMTIVAIVYFSFTLVSNSIEIKNLKNVNHDLEVDNSNLTYQVKACRQLVAQ